METFRTDLHSVVDLPFSGSVTAVIYARGGKFCVALKAGYLDGGKNWAAMQVGLDAEATDVIDHRSNIEALADLVERVRKL